MFDPTLGLAIVLQGRGGAARFLLVWGAMALGLALGGAPALSVLTGASVLALAARFGRWLLSRHTALQRPFQNVGEVVSAALLVALPTTAVAMLDGWGRDWSTLIVDAVRTALGVLGVLPLVMARREWSSAKDLRRVALGAVAASLVVVGSNELASVSPAASMAAVTLLLPIAILVASWAGGFGASLIFATVLIVASATGIPLRIARHSGAPDWMDHAALMLELGLIGLVAQALAAANAGRALSERRLRESEQRLARAAELSHLGYWELQLDTGKLTWSAGAEKVLGPCRDEDAGGLSWLLSRLKSADARSLELALADAIAGKQPFEVLFGFVALSGEERTAVLRGEPRLDWRGEVEALTGSLQDVTDQLRQEEALRASRERISSILETMSDAVVSLSPDLKSVLHANHAVRRILGLSPEALAADPRWLTAALEANGASEGGFWETLLESGEASAVRRVACPDGRSRWLRVAARVFRSVAGEPLRVDLILTDVTREREATAALELSERRYRRLFETMNQGVLYLSEDGRIVRVNGAACAVLGVAADRLQGETLGAALRPVDESRSPIPDEDLPPQVDGGRTSGSALIGAYNRKQYDHRWVVLDWFRESGELPDGARYQVILTDITKLKRLQDELERMAYTDPLTGLPNLGMFRDRLEHTLRNAERYGDTVGVLFVDLDLFKQVNDHYGHHVGDELLKEVAQRLKQTVRRSDTVARLGGDEFVILLSKIKSPSDVDLVATKILAAFESSFHPGGVELHCSCSVGSAVYSGGERSAADLVARADEAMYSAKAAGRSGYRRAAAMESAVLELSLEAELRTSLASGQILPHFQPVVDVGSLRVIGAEALARWQHPVHGLLEAGKFVPIAERTGLIVPLGLAVIGAALREAAAWVHRHPGFRLAVNVSPRQLAAPGFLEALERLLRQTSFPAEALDLEVTETGSLDPQDLVIGALHGSRSLGCRVVLDDLGVGHSTLGHVLSLPVDGVKIDRCFARHLCNGKRYVELLAGLLEVFDRFGLRTVVEGVENLEQWKVLR
ncbi:MAG: EAL domain-containing protein, partial [Fimbriimonadales bacterium]|nr:EAL domain-containing protein [Fimbriimonadales bacterium]